MDQTRLLAIFFSFAFTTMAGCAIESSGESEKTPETDKTPRPDKTPITPDDPDAPDTPPPETPDDSCQWARDGECDDPEYCAPGTDVSDCSGVPLPESDTCQWANDGVCDDPAYCAPGTDATDCSSSAPPSDDTCEWANDGECDEPDICAFGTDTSDCSDSESPSDNSCQYANDGECDEPDLCADGTDTFDCDNVPGPGETAITYTVIPNGLDVSSTPILVAGNNNDADTSITCQFDAVVGGITVEATVGDHELYMEVESLTAAETCVYNEGDFRDFVYATPALGSFWIEEVDGYNFSSNYDCTDTGVGGDYLDLRFGSDQGLYRDGDADGGLETSVEIANGVLRCYW